MQRARAHTHRTQRITERQNKHTADYRDTQSAYGLEQAPGGGLRVRFHRAAAAAYEITNAIATTRVCGQQIA